MKFKKPKGYSLIEVVVYTALVVVVGGVTAALTLQMVLSVGRTRASLTALDNARRAMDVMTREISYADSVYSPTTTENQLTIQTQHGIDVEVLPLPYTFVDYFLSNGVLYKHREGSIEQITSDNITVTDFSVSKIDSHDAVKISLTVQYNTSRDDLRQQSEVTLHSTVTMRSYE